MFSSVMLLMLLSASFVCSLMIGGSSSVVVKHQGRKTTLLHAGNSPVSAEVIGNSPLTSFLADAASLGPIRFVVVGTGAILVRHHDSDFHLLLGSTIITYILSSHTSCLSAIFFLVVRKRLAPLVTYDTQIPPKVD